MNSQRSGFSRWRAYTLFTIKDIMVESVYGREWLREREREEALSSSMARCHRRPWNISAASVLLCSSSRQPRPIRAPKASKWQMKDDTWNWSCSRGQQRVSASFFSHEEKRVPPRIFSLLYVSVRGILLWKGRRRLWNIQESSYTQAGNMVRFSSHFSSLLAHCIKNDGRV